MTEGILHWRTLAYTIDGYTLWGSFERCARVGSQVLEAARSGAPIARFSVDELRTALFFSARAEHHAGDAHASSDAEDAVAREVVERMGIEWARAEISRSTRSPTDRADPHEDAALGALLGAACGDAAGAVLEFMGRAPTMAEVERALRMPGGGVWRVAPGQVTDDGELLICLARGLAGGGEFAVERIAAEYASWYRSAPFDIGNTTRASIGSVGKNPDRKSLALTMRTSAATHCTESKANGSLMRAAPLGVFCAGRESAQIAEVARADSELTHPNRSCCDAVACYAIAIAHLVETPRDRADAFRRAETWARGNADREVVAWLDEARTGRLPPAHPMAGFVRIAFTHAFGLLLSGSSYEEALRVVLSLGGDTDTNACIVGGLIGAAEGVDGIPEDMRKAVLGCRTEDGQPRPEFLHPRQLPTLARSLLALSATRA